MDELVLKLSTGKHQVAATRTKTIEELKEQIGRKYILIKFTETKGGTELGVKLDDSRSKIDEDMFETGKGVISLAGELELNYERVCCVASLDIETMKGEGSLELLNTPLQGCNVFVANGNMLN